jgi:hypothetical protein
MKKLNIIWIVIDGVRPHNKYNDPSDRPDIFDDFSKDCVEFTNVITSAPSTVMSVSAMMSSYPSFYLSRTFYSFNFDENIFNSLPSILRKEGYHIYNMLSAYEDIKLLSTLFKDDCKEYWPKNINYYERYWPVSAIDRMSFNVLDKIKQPFFYYTHYPNPPNISQLIFKLIKKIKKENLYENSIIILTSDHGISPKEYQQKNLGIIRGHDIDMDNGALYVPLLIKFPNCPIKKIEQHISTLDITPTILGVLEIDPVKYNFKGNNLINIIEGKEKNNEQRFFRTDNRYIFQPSRITSLVNPCFKYMYNHDTKEEWFYDIKKDFFEKKNLINENSPQIKEKLNVFREEFQDQEKEALLFHKSYLQSKFKKIIKKKNLRDITNVFLPTVGSPLFINILKECILTSFPDVKINEKIKKFDLAVIPLINESGIGYQNILKKLKKIEVKNVLYTDYNLDPRKKPNLSQYIHQHLSNNYKFYLYNPKAFITWVLRIIIKKIKNQDIHKSMK